MANHNIKDPKEFSTELRRLETSDPAHADTFNPLYEKLINNDAYLKQEVDKKETPAGAQEKANIAEQNAKAYTNERVDSIQFPVTSVNNKTGAVSLNATDVGAETPAGAQAKVNAVRQDLETHKAEIATNAHLAKNIGLQSVNFEANNVEDGMNELKDEVDSKESPSGAQAKANAALNAAKEYTDEEVEKIADALTSHKADNIRHRQIFVSNLDPDNTIGEDGDIWIKYVE